MGWKENLYIGELRFWEKYLKIKTFRDFETEHLYHFKDCFEVPLEVFSKTVILDVGAGGVSHLYTIKAKIRIAIDPLMNEFNKLTKRFDFPSNDIIRLEGCGEQLPFIGEIFDFIFAFNGIDHWEDWQKGILEMKRVLRKNGQLLIYVNFDRPSKNPHHPHNINESSIEWIKRQNLSLIKSKIIYDAKNIRKFFGVFKK